MKYKLVASDIDGTLIPDSGTLSARNREAIARLHERGVIFTLASGRSISTMKCFLPLVEEGIPVIASNGAETVATSGQVIHEQRMDAGTTGRILDLGKKLAPSLIVWDGDIMYTNRLHADVDRYQEFCGVPVTIRSLEELSKISATKMVWFDSSGGIEKTLEALRCEDTSGFDFFTSHRYFIEFVAAGVSKGNALKRVAESLGVFREEVIALGDGMNDLSMIEYAGLGVAMGNTNDRLRSAADHVTDKVEEDGFAQAIEKFVLC